MPHPLGLLAIAIAVLLPSTLSAAFGSLLGMAWVVDALQRGQHIGAAAALVAAMAAGWFGLITSWRLYYRLRRQDLAFDHRIAWCGLASGALVCIALIAMTGGSLLSRWCFFGWPLWAAAFFSVVLWRARPQGPEAAHAPRSSRHGLGQTGDVVAHHVGRSVPTDSEYHSP